MLPSALLVSPLFGDSVHYEILVFGLIEGAAIFGAASPLHRGWTKFATCAVALSRSEAIGHTEKPYVSL
jgi:hypothetical protein